MNRLPVLLTVIVLLPSFAGAAGTGSAETPDPAVVTAAIENARDGDRGFDLLAQCSDDDRNRSLEVFPGGVAIWNGRLQLTLPPQARRGLLDTLLDRGFAAMEPSYGGKRPPQPEPPTDGAAPVRVHCRITFASGGVGKTSIQQTQGDQSPELIGLVNAVLDRVEPLVAKSGVGADDLPDGLAKLSRGELAPETFSLRFVRLPQNGAGTPGSIVRVDRSTLTRRAYAPKRELGEPESDELDAGRFVGLVEAIRAADLSSMPPNLWADDQLELEVRVLDHDATILARPFRGRAAEDGGDVQKRFDALVGFLRRTLLGDGEAGTAAID